METTLEDQIDENARRCPACDIAKTRSRGRKNGFEILSCRRCGTLYTSYLPASESTMDYDSYYSPQNIEKPNFVHKRLDEIVSKLACYRLKNRLLEIGFGSGEMMQAAARAGWDVEGTEISRPAVKHARSMGFKVFHGDLFEARYPNQYFDVVVANELLEHVSDPAALIQEVARLLRLGGIFQATTPHSEGISARVLGMHWSVISPPEHLQLFSVTGIKTCLAAAGLHQISVATHGVNPFEIWQVLLSKKRGHSKKNVARRVRRQCFDRVETSYQLNAFMTQSWYRRLLKDVLNGLLSGSRLGDSLKINAKRII
jgi:SAM-dependent methyltransferase